ncbi:MAG: HAMP domain-containing protein [Gammaproteobacteria bacterium]|nr:HAMP domain-containing protein [Gammaproteobacteria bacterium]MBU1414137.1 HAMP domain-containing protein [Gammaproteobacteria bacterium]
MTVLGELLRALAAGQIPAKVPPDCEYSEEVGELIAYLNDLTRFQRAMAAGDLSAKIERRGALAGALKGLHANLRHLTWQTQQVAAGDFKQRVDFLGEFSVAFNSMVEALAQARDDLVTKNDQLATAYAELKSAQAQLLQQEKMASVGQLAAGIAHEINNPMGFIQSNLGTLGSYGDALKSYVEKTEELEAQCPEAVRNTLSEQRKELDLEFIFEDLPTLISESVSGAKRVRDIVQSLKNFSHVDEAEVQRININDCIESTILTTEGALRPKADVVREYGELPAIECRPHLLSQLFLNLLQNAAAAIPEHGEIRIKTWVDGDMVAASVTDTGCGIPKEILNRIFEPFFTTKPVGTGTGLGLANVYDAVKKHHGKIGVTSTVGTGSTFTIRLPIKSSAASAADGKPPAGPPA